MPFLVAEILNFQGSAHHVGVGSLSLLFLTNIILIKRVFLISAMFFKNIFVFNKQSLAHLKSDMQLIFQILCLYPGKNFICKIPDCCFSFADQFQECQDV